MKVLCVNNGEYPARLTVGKWYEVFDDMDDCYVIFDDSGRDFGYYKYRFMVLREVRKEKLLKLGGCRL